MARRDAARSGWTPCGQCHRWIYNYKLAFRPHCVCGAQFRVPAWGAAALGTTEPPARGGKEEAEVPAYVVELLVATKDANPGLVEQLIEKYPQLKPKKPSKPSALYSEATTKVASTLRAQEKALDKSVALQLQLDKSKEELAAAVLAHEQAVEFADSVKERLARDGGPIIPGSSASKITRPKANLPDGASEAARAAAEAYNKLAEETSTKLEATIAEVRARYAELLEKQFVKAPQPAEDGGGLGRPSKIGRAADSMDVTEGVENDGQGVEAMAVDNNAGEEHSQKAQDNNNKKTPDDNKAKSEEERKSALLKSFMEQAEKQAKELRSKGGAAQASQPTRSG